MGRVTPYFMDFSGCLYHQNSIRPPCILLDAMAHGNPTAKTHGKLLQCPEPSLLPVPLRFLRFPAFFFFSVKHFLKQTKATWFLSRVKHLIKKNMLVGDGYVVDGWTTHFKEEHVCNRQSNDGNKHLANFRSGTKKTQDVFGTAALRKGYMPNLRVARGFTTCWKHQKVDVYFLQTWSFFSAFLSGILSTKKLFTKHRGGNRTVDASEILLTSWGWWFIPLFIGFLHPRWCRISSINHNMDVQEFMTNLRWIPKS